MYEINVSLNGRHLFATHERSLDTTQKFMYCLSVMMLKFPPDEGYEITASYFERTNYGIDINNVEESIEQILNSD